MNGISSDTVDISCTDASGNQLIFKGLQKKVEINLPRDSASIADNSAQSCRYLDVITGTWKSDGCSVTNDTADYITCQCDHMT